MATRKPKQTVRKMHRTVQVELVQFYVLMGMHASAGPHDGFYLDGYGPQVSFTTRDGREVGRRTNHGSYATFEVDPLIIPEAEKLTE